MPKEVVYGRAHVLENPDGTLAPIEEQGRPQIEVHWMGEEQGGNLVQLVTKAVNPLGGRVVEDDPGIHYTDGFWVELDRSGLNRLIRNLRRARDQAFGRDE